MSVIKRCIDAPGEVMKKFVDVGDGAHAEIVTLTILDLIAYPVDGALTTDGVQYSAEVTTGVANTDVEVLKKTVEPPLEGTLLSLEFGLTAEFRAVSTATADLIWKWQARNKDGTWVDLHGAVTETDIGTTYVSRSRSGYASIVANLYKVPFDVRLILKCNEANQGQAKVSGKSYINFAYQVI